MKSKLRILPIGGLGEVGKNMTAIEYEDEIIIIDAGIMFPENDMLGIDFIIPDYEYLRQRKDDVKAVLITHAHEDHVGALPHLLTEIPVPIYGTKLTMGLVEGKLRRSRLAATPSINVIKPGDKFTIGSFEIEPFHVAHSIPDGVGFGITTPVGLIVHTGDYKFDHTPVDGWPPDFARLAEFSERGVLALLADSTNAERPGWTRSEKVIDAAFDKLFREAEGRIIIATFASLLSRVQQVCDAAKRYDRKLAVTGRSMRENVKIARRLGYLSLPEEMLIDISKANSLPANKVVILATGSQGEPTAVMGRLAHGTHRSMSIQKGDTVVLSAHPIPGNEEMIYAIVNRLFQKGANVLYEDIADVHVSGHASQEEMKLMLNLVKPRFFIPIHGELRHLIAHARLAQEQGIKEEDMVVVENGTVLELTSDSLTVGERIPGGYVFVDGSGVGDVGPVVMRERSRLASSGYFIVSVKLDSQGLLAGDPEILSKGFVYLDGAEELLAGTKATVERVLSSSNLRGQQLKDKLDKEVFRFLSRETGRQPVVEVLVDIK